MFGYLIPRNYMKAIQFDSENKSSKWYDAIKLEMESMLEYKVFKKWDKAILNKHKQVMNSPKGYGFLTGGTNSVDRLNSVSCRLDTSTERLECQ